METDIARGAESEMNDQSATGREEGRNELDTVEVNMNTKVGKHRCLRSKHLVACSGEGAYAPPT
jgi:hypothetical protein